MMPMGHCKTCGFTHALSEEELCFSCEKNVLVAELRARCERAERERDDARLVNQVVNYPGMASVVHRLAEAEGLLRRAQREVGCEMLRDVKSFLANRPANPASANPPAGEAWLCPECGVREPCHWLYCPMCGVARDNRTEPLAHQPLDTSPKLE